MLPSKGVVSASRGKVLLAHYRTPGASSAAAAATAASNAAAAAAGLLPPEAAGGAHPAFFNGPNPGVWPSCFHPLPQCTNTLNVQPLLAPCNRGTQR